MKNTYGQRVRHNEDQLKQKTEEELETLIPKLGRNITVAEERARQYEVQVEIARAQYELARELSKEADIDLAVAENALSFAERHLSDIEAGVFETETK